MTPSKQQIGGDHYTRLPYQPMKFAMENGWDPCAYMILKYISRHTHKNGAQDLQKAVHMVDMRRSLQDSHSCWISQWQRVPMDVYIDANRPVLDIHTLLALDALGKWMDIPNTAGTRMRREDTAGILKNMIEICLDHHYRNYEGV